MIGMMASFTIKLFIIWPFLFINWASAHIDIVDTGIFGFLCYALLSVYTPVEKKWKIIIAVAVALVFLVVFHFTKLGYWCCSTAASAAWGYIGVGISDVIMELLTKEPNTIARVIGWALAFALFVRWHEYAKNRAKYVAAYEQEEAEAKLRAAGYDPVAERFENERIQREIQDMLDNFYEQQEKQNRQQMEKPVKRRLRLASPKPVVTAEKDI